jgi:hypothetical protein
VIAWDSDVDIGIYDPVFDFRRIARRLPVMWYSGVGTTITGATAWLEVRIDFYRYFDYRGQIAAAMYSIHAPGVVKFVVFPRSIIEAGVQRGTFSGVACNVLRQAHQYCRTLYGDSYMIPNRDYDYWRDPANAIVPQGSDDAGETMDIGKPFWRWRPGGVAAAVARSSNRLAPLDALSRRLRGNSRLAYLATRALIRLCDRQTASHG